MSAGMATFDKSDGEDLEVGIGATETLVEGVYFDPLWLPGGLARGKLSARFVAYFKTAPDGAVFRIRYGGGAAAVDGILLATFATISGGVGVYSKLVENMIVPPGAGLLKLTGQRTTGSTITTYTWSIF